MIVKSAKDHEIDLSRSYMIGDKAIDVLSGINAGVKTVLIRSNSLEKEISTLHNQGKKPNFVAANFKDACDFILSDLTGGN
jgi:histidinol phosphatase-like enzyme